MRELELLREFMEITESYGVDEERLLIFRRKVELALEDRSDRGLAYMRSEGSDGL